MLLRLLFFFLVLLPYMLIAAPLQFLITRLGLPGWNALPRLFHKLSCIFFGIRITVLGKPETNRPTLLVSNHISWTDILSIGAVANITFVAKSDIAKWPMVGFLASLQKTIFVDRTRRTDAKRTSKEMADRMADGGAVLLFAEGQSDIGTHVLPFRSALVGAAQAAMMQAGAKNTVLQPMTIAYTRLQGMPVSRNERSLIAWIKSKSIGENVREILSGSIKDVTIAFGDPKPLSEADNRKVLTKQAENEVRKMLVALNRGEKLLVPTR